MQNNQQTFLMKQPQIHTAAIEEDAFRATRFNAKEQPELQRDDNPDMGQLEVVRGAEDQVVNEEDFCARPAMTFRSTAPNLDDPAVQARNSKLHYLQQEHESYHAILAAGGRPCHRPHDSDPAIFKDPANRSPIINYWIYRHNHANNDYERPLWLQLNNWEKFKQDQNDIRRGGEEIPGKLQRRSQGWNAYRAKHGMPGTLDFSVKPAELTALETWREYQTRNHSLRYPFVVAWQEAKARVLKLREDLEIAAHSGALMGEQRERAKEICKAERRRLKLEEPAKQASVLLEWIAEQLDLIAAEEVIQDDRTTSVTAMVDISRDCGDDYLTNQKRTRNLLVEVGPTTAT